LCDEWFDSPIQKLSDEEFKEEVKGFVEANESWIIDGNYTRVVGDILQEKATCILCRVLQCLYLRHSMILSPGLDPPFTLYFPRLLWRTFGRVFRFKEPCSAGCEERLSNIFTWGEKSIIWWCWNHHDVVQKRCLALMQESRENKASKWVRLGGCGRDAEEWFSRVATIGKNI